MEKHTAKGKKVWIIDDDKSYRFLATRIIELSQAQPGEIVEFNSGEKALHFLSSHAGEINKLPDVILLDINMPRMNGWEFMEEFAHINKSLAKNATVYIVSSSDNESDISRARNNPHITDYIIKPISPERFREIILAN